MRTLPCCSGHSGGRWPWYHPVSQHWNCMLWYINGHFSQLDLVSAMKRDGCSSSSGVRGHQQHPADLQKCTQRGKQTQAGGWGVLLQLAKVWGALLWQGDREPQKSILHPDRRLHRPVSGARVRAQTSAAPERPALCRDPGGLQRGRRPAQRIAVGSCAHRDKWESGRYARRLPREHPGGLGLWAAGVPHSLQQLGGWLTEDP